MTEHKEPAARDDEGVPVDSPPTEGGDVRRAARAEYEVTAGVGSQAILREAMDPANQSLQDALRLSFRLLQVVILTLILVFIFSGFQTVEPQQTGVMLRFGRILGEGEGTALEPGLQFSMLPFPAGEYILFDEKNRAFTLGDSFWPRRRPGQTFDDAVAAASTNDMIRPGRDGSLLVSGGDIAHARILGSWELVDPVSYVRTLEDRDSAQGGLDGSGLVELLVQQAMVHMAASRDLVEFIEYPDEGLDLIRARAQKGLDRVECGIRISGIEYPIDPTPALAIRKAFGDLQQSRSTSQQLIETAREDAHRILIDMAGADVGTLISLIDAYEAAEAAGETDRVTELLDRINLQLDAETTTGTVSQMIQFARSYIYIIEVTLGQEAQRFKSLLPAYRESPEMVVGRLWAEAYARVLSREDVEVIYAPAGLGKFMLQLSGYSEISQIRRRNMLERKEQSELIRGLDLMNPYMRRAAEIQLQGPGRQLDRGGRSLNTGPGS